MVDFKVTVNLDVSFDIITDLKILLKLDLLTLSLNIEVDFKTGTAFDLESLSVKLTLGL